MSTRSSNNKVKRCPNTSTTDCVEWVAGDFECLGICDGDILSSAQYNIATAICDLLNTTDLSSVVLPDCLVEAWGTNDPTILNFIQFLLDKHCEQQALIESLNTNEFTLETGFVITYPSCCSDECEDSPVLTLSQHLKKILTCLCQQYDRIQTLETQIQELATKTSLATLQSQVDCLKGAIIAWNLNPNNTTNQINVSTC